MTAEADKVAYHFGENMKVKIPEKNLNSTPVHKRITDIIIGLSDRTGRSLIEIGVFPTWDSANMLNPGEEREIVLGCARGQGTDLSRG